LEKKRNFGYLIVIFPILTRPKWRCLMMFAANQPELIMFKPHAVYSLDPAEDSGIAIGIDNDPETVSLLGTK
jgi:hypothetical protein